MTGKKKMRAIFAPVLLAAAMLLFSGMSAFADADFTSSLMFSYQNIERGITVVPNGNIYTITEGGYLRIFNSSGSLVYSRTLPTEYCGNLCSASDGTVFAHGVGSNNNIYIFGPGSTNYKTVSAGTACEFLATDSNGFLYNINSSGKSAEGKKATVIFRARIADVVSLASGGTVAWDQTWQPDYTPPASSGICYPAALDVDGAGNAYIVDQGSYNGYDASVSGIYKYNLNTGSLMALRFGAEGNVYKMTWLKSVTADDYGNVAVLGRNSNGIAVFRKGSTVADAIVSIPGFCDDLDSFPDGDIVFSAEKNGTASKNGVYRISAGSIGVTGLTLSDTEKEIEVDSSFHLSAEVLPDNATNSSVLYTSSDSAVASVTADGEVKAHKSGTAVITVKTVQGGITGECTVTVIPKEDPAQSGSGSGQGSGAEGTGSAGGSGTQQASGGSGTQQTAGTTGGSGTQQASGTSGGSATQQTSGTSGGNGTQQASGTGTAKTSAGTSAGITVKKLVNGTRVPTPSGTIRIISVKKKTAAFVKAKNAKTVTVPATQKINGKVYKITQINAGAFTGKKIRTVTVGKNVKKISSYAFRKSPAAKLILKTKLLTKTAVKGSLKGSKVKTVQVKVGTKAANKKYLNQYKKIFTKKITGKKVAVK